MATTRRALLLGASAILAIAGSRRAKAACASPCKPLLGSTVAREFFGLIAATPVVDVHGHIFNASDLPILEWLNEVEIANKIDELGVPDLLQEWADGAARSALKTTLAKELVHLRVAPAAHCETFLINLLLSDRNLRRQVIGNNRTTRDFHGQLIRIAAKNATVANTRFLNAACLSVEPQVDFGRIEKRESKAVDILASRYATLMTKLSVSRKCPVEGTPALIESLKAFSAPLTRTRLENLLDWRRTFSVVTTDGREARPIALFAPAILDIDYWLRYERNGQAAHTEEPLFTQQSSIADQVNVVSG